MPFRFRRSVTVICLAIALASAFAPAVTIDGASVVLTPVWQYEPPIAVIVLPQRDGRSKEQATSLLERLPSRAPPQ